MRGAVLAPVNAPELSQVSHPGVLYQSGEAFSPFGEDESQPWLARATAPLSFLQHLSFQEADLDAAAGSGTPRPSSDEWTRLFSLRGAVLAPAPNTSVLHPGPAGAEGIHVLPTGTFTMGGELMHCFVSYRVTTEGIVLTLRQSSAETCALLLSRPSRAPAAHRAPLTPTL